MVKFSKDDEHHDSPSAPPRVVADFGGRRKTYERRLKKKGVNHIDRRSENDRRSGFDRRGVKTEEPTTPSAEPRNDDQQPRLKMDE